MSSGERALARFFAGVWLGNNQFNFDVIEHIHDFDLKAMAVFHNWAIDPYIP